MTTQARSVSSAGLPPAPRRVQRHGNGSGRLTTAHSDIWRSRKEGRRLPPLIGDSCPAQRTDARRTTTERHITTESASIRRKCPLKIQTSTSPRGFARLLLSSFADFYHYHLTRQLHLNFISPYRRRRQSARKMMIIEDCKEADY